MTIRLSDALPPVLGLLLAAAALVQPARAQTSAESTTTGSTSISVPAALTVTQNLAFSITPSALNTGLTITSATASGVNANFALTGGQTASISVPATFEVIRLGGTESVTVRAITPAGAFAAGGGEVAGVANGSFFSGPVSVVGNIDGGVLSFSVGGAVTVASNLTPGQYQGVLKVIAQFN